MCTSDRTCVQQVTAKADSLKEVMKVFATIYAADPATTVLLTLFADLYATDFKPGWSFWNRRKDFTVTAKRKFQMQEYTLLIDLD